VGRGWRRVHGVVLVENAEDAGLGGDYGKLYRSECVVTRLNGYRDGPTRRDSKRNHGVDLAVRGIDDRGGS
jgi:hypothetical protein